MSTEKNTLTKSNNKGFMFLILFTVALLVIGIIGSIYK